MWDRPIIPAGVLSKLQTAFGIRRMRHCSSLVVPLCPCCPSPPERGVGRPLVQTPGSLSNKVGFCGLSVRGWRPCMTADPLISVYDARSFVKSGTARSCWVELFGSASSSKLMGSDLICRFRSVPGIGLLPAAVAALAKVGVQRAASE